MTAFLRLFLKFYPADAPQRQNTEPFSVFLFAGFILTSCRRFVKRASMAEEKKQPPLPNAVTAAQKTLILLPFPDKPLIPLSFSDKPDLFF
ncbi:MAG: hypothetical protein SOZ59_06275 [Candidatus Limivivens sp.]|nr:hypothetical protein [Candidatus Limivivens sp.]